MQRKPGDSWSHKCKSTSRQVHEVTPTCLSIGVHAPWIGSFGDSDGLCVARERFVRQCGFVCNVEFSEKFARCEGIYAKPWRVQQLVLDTMDHKWGATTFYLYSSCLAHWMCLRKNWVRTEMPSPLREVCLGACFGGKFRGMFRGSISCHLKRETRWAFFIDA